MSEFDMIQRYFYPLAQGHEAARGFQSDTAALPVPDGQQIVLTTDTLNEGVHFFKNTNPVIIAQKALRSNLSDVMAGGGDPLCYQLAVAFSSAPDSGWLSAFTAALKTDQDALDLFCSGGDTTSVQAGLSITITMIGLQPRGKGITRAGAQDGDAIIVTGALGEGYGAYQRGETIAPPRHHKDMAAVVRAYANAAVDISDGLLADIGHVAQASLMDAALDLDAIPISDCDPMQAIVGGDDYHIALSVPRDKTAQCLRALQEIGAHPAIIGHFVKGRGQISLLGDAGEELELPKKQGWQHF